MLGENNNGRWRALLRSRWFTLSVLFLGLLFATGWLRAWYQNYQIRREIIGLEAQAARLEARRLKILDQLDYVRSSAFVEEKARTELNLSLPGERVAVVGDVSASAMARQTAEDLITSLERPGNPRTWWRYFFSKKNN